MAVSCSPGSGEEEEEEEEHVSSRHQGHQQERMQATAEVTEPAGSSKPTIIPAIAGQLCIRKSCTCMLTLAVTQA